MKKRVLPFLIGLLALGMIAGCGGDPPQAELDAASKALQDARSAGAEKYASSELSSAQRAFDDAKGAFDSEADKMFKDWEKVKPQLADARRKADDARSTASQAKNQARSAAESAIAAAAAAGQTARASLDGAPAGKGTESDIEQLRTDLGGADADLSAARSSVSRENFEEASSKASSARSSADAVAQGVQQAVAKYNELVEKNKPWYLKM